MAQAKSSKRIRMNTGTCRDVQRHMENSGNQLENQVRRVRLVADDLVGSYFVAPSANQFHSEIDNWSRETNHLLNELQSLADRLGREIRKYIDADRRLGR
jgi:uncharacterized protein YukE